MSERALREERDRAARRRLGLPEREGAGEWDGAHQRRPVQHGTMAGYRAELLQGGPANVCAPCRTAGKADRRERYERNKAEEQIRGRERSREVMERYYSDGEFAEMLRAMWRANGRRRRNDPAYRERMRAYLREYRRRPKPPESAEAREARLTRRREYERAFWAGLSPEERARRNEKRNARRRALYAARRGAG